MSVTRLKELLVLSTLRAHPLHGYALVEALEGGLGWTLGLTRPTVYAILRRFVERGWIVGDVVKDSRLPEREVFRVVEAGEAAYHALLAGCADGLPEAQYPIAVAIAHLDELDAAVRHRLLSGLLAQRRRRLASLHAFPMHDGGFGAALALLRRQVLAEVEALEALLGT